MDMLLDTIFMIAGMAIGFSLPYLFLGLSNYRPKKLFKMTIIEDETIQEKEENK